MMCLTPGIGRRAAARAACPPGHGRGRAGAARDLARRFRGQRHDGAGDAGKGLDRGLPAARVGSIAFASPGSTGMARNTLPSRR